jgi:hypothetical protein
MLFIKLSRNVWQIGLNNIFQTIYIPHNKLSLKEEESVITLSLPRKLPTLSNSFPGNKMLSC